MPLSFFVSESFGTTLGIQMTNSQQAGTLSESGYHP